MRAVIFVNGTVEDNQSMRDRLLPDDYIICADGGVRHCLALGLTPRVIVGDMDSADPSVLRDLHQRGAQIERHPPVKDQTDLELALERALRDGADEILLLGALGGRLDQTLANLHIVAQRRWPVPIQIAEGGQAAQIITGGDRLILHAPAGSTVSAIPFSPQVTGINYTGLRYPLTDATLRFGSTRGISNRIATEPAIIEIDQGVLLVVVDVEAETNETESRIKIDLSDQGMAKAYGAAVDHLTKTVTDTAANTMADTVAESVTESIPEIVERTADELETAKGGKERQRPAKSGEE